MRIVLTNQTVCAACIAVALSLTSFIASAGNEYSNRAGTLVQVFDDPTQSYRVYIPPNAPDEGPYSILYGFDPTGSSANGIRLLRDMAEEQGWILAVSENSENGPTDVIIAAQDAVMRDSEQRFDLHPWRRFAGGFSGGARAALGLAYRYPDKVKGVIGMGAGTWSSSPPDNPGLVVYSLIGREDSNRFNDIPRLSSVLMYGGYPHYVQAYNGGHVWPPIFEREAGARWVAEHVNTGLQPNFQVCNIEDQVNHSIFVGYGTDHYISQIGADYNAYQWVDDLEGSIESLTWWGITFQKISDSFRYCIRQDDEFRIAFIADDAGAPGPEAYAAWTVTPEKEYTGQVSSGYELYRYHWELPEPLDIDEAWLRIAGTEQGDNCNFAWSDTFAFPLRPSVSYYFGNDPEIGPIIPLDYQLSVCVQTDVPFSFDGEFPIEAELPLEAENPTEGSDGDGEAMTPEGDGNNDGEASSGGEEGDPTEGGVEAEPQEGAVEGGGEGQPTEGAGEDPDEYHTTDIDRDLSLGLPELLRTIQIFNSGAFHCAVEPGEDRFALGYDPHYRDCAPHDGDYAPRNWSFNLSEILRQVQLFSIGGYLFCPESEDGFCPDDGGPFLGT